MASRSSGGIRRRTSYDKIGNMFPDGNPGCRMLLTIWYGETSDVERLRRSYIYEGTTVVVPELLGSAAYQGELLFSFGPLLLLSNPLGDKQQSTLSRRSVGYRVPKPLPVRVSPIQPRITLGVAGNEKRVINATTPTPVPPLNDTHLTLAQHDLARRQEASVVTVAKQHAIRPRLHPAAPTSHCFHFPTLAISQAVRAIIRPLRSPSAAPGKQSKPHDGRDVTEKVY